MSDYLPVAEQLNILFEEFTHPDGRPYTLKEVSDATGISLATLSQIRTGRILNPQLNTLRDICRYFNVSLDFFGTRSREECFGVILSRQERSDEIHEIAYRANRLSEKAQRDILTFIGWIRAAEEVTEREGLPPLPHLKPYDVD